MSHPSADGATERWDAVRRRTTPVDQQRSAGTAGWRNKASRVGGWLRQAWRRTSRAAGAGLKWVVPRILTHFVVKFLYHAYEWLNGDGFNLF